MGLEGDNFEGCNYENGTATVWLGIQDKECENIMRYRLCKIDSGDIVERVGSIQIARVGMSDSKAII